MKGATVPHTNKKARKKTALMQYTYAQGTVAYMD